MHVKPVSGRQVPDPDKGGYLPPEGRAVEATAYWLRRLSDGDVTEKEADAQVSAEIKTKRKGAEA